ncbi:uncharacterized protein LOC119074359 [Bradysia coprophila]|uniref:uncharacterized protein LOC119074359 n=1 Tax=Bradysia coprophila TaxID=38358 RepID=UPI00187DB42C|nr:uncharacterized protein LOC119074359 [Bradysia coprophila]
MKRYCVLLAGIILLSQYSSTHDGTLLLKYRSDVDGVQSHNDAVANLINTAVADHFPTSGSCRIDPNNKSITVQNLRFHCSQKQLQRIFLNLTPRSLPSGSLRGYTILGHEKHHDGLIGLVWHGKTFNYPNGGGRGVVTNNVVHVFELLRASIFPSIAPMDGRKAFEIDYRGDILSFLMVDYLRNVHPNLYLGYFAFRAFNKVPIGYFLLESD